jgi:phytoene dehydrogenase-like protein
VPASVALDAPDLRDKIRAIDILTPDDLRDCNPNAVSGDPYGGSAELDQSFLWRPLPSPGPHATPVGRLWHIGGSTHPERVSAVSPDISSQPR